MKKNFYIDFYIKKYTIYKNMLNKKNKSYGYINYFRNNSTNCWIIYLLRRLSYQQDCKKNRRQNLCWKQRPTNWRVRQIKRGKGWQTWTSCALFVYPRHYSITVTECDIYCNSGERRAWKAWNAWNHLHNSLCNSNPYNKTILDFSTTKIARIFHAILF